MQNGGRAVAITDCGVTPQAQKTGTSSSPTRTASPQSGRLTSFSRRTRPYAELLDSLVGLDPRPRVHASASLATVIRMAVDGLGIAAMPVAIAQAEIAAGRLDVLPLASGLPDLVFTASWPASPAAFLPEALAALAVETASEPG